jgi:hypothetical protein
MKIEKIRQVIEEYEELLISLGAKPKQFEDYDKVGYHPEEADLDHLCYMTTQMPELLDHGKKEKVCCWLGFIQGVFFAMGVKSLNELKNDSRPDEKEQQ